MDADISTSTIVHSAMTTDSIALELMLDTLNLQITPHSTTGNGIGTGHCEIATHCTEIDLRCIGENGIATNIARIQARHMHRLQVPSNVCQTGHPVYIGQFYIAVNILQE